MGLTIATVNDDFTDDKTNLRRVKAGVVMVQEAKNTRVREALNRERFGVHQGLRDDRAGAAIAWKRESVKAGERGYSLGVEPRGAAMLRRLISWVDVSVGGAKVRMISVHRPPARFKRLWPEFDRNLAAFIKQTKGPVVVGMDANQRNPRALAHLTGLRWHSPQGSIDGFLASRSVHFDRMWRAPKGTSDHHPVLARISLRRAS